MQTRYAAGTCAGDNKCEEREDKEIEKGRGREREIISF